MSNEAKQQFLKATVLADAIQYQPESTVSKVILKNASGSATLFAFSEGQQLSEHSSPSDALVIVTEGSGRFVIGGVDHKVSSSQSIILPANIPHAVHADESFKMLLVLIRG